MACGLSCPAACGILVPRPGMEPASPALEGGFFTTGPPGKSPHRLLNDSSYCPHGLSPQLSKSTPSPVSHPHSSKLRAEVYQPLPSIPGNQTVSPTAAQSLPLMTESQPPLSLSQVRLSSQSSTDRKLTQLPPRAYNLHAPHSPAPSLTHRAPKPLVPTAQ